MCHMTRLKGSSLVKETFLNMFDYETMLSFTFEFIDLYKKIRMTLKYNYKSHHHLHYMTVEHLLKYQLCIRKTESVSADGHVVIQNNTPVQIPSTLKSNK